MLVSLCPDMIGYVLPDGTMIVHMDFMLYGYMEAGKLWYEHLMRIYLAKGFTVNLADPCVIHYKSEAGEVHGSVTVDDTLFTFSSDAVLHEVEAMYREAFGADGYTSEKGDDFMHLGMRIVQFGGWLGGHIAGGFCVRADKASRADDCEVRSATWVDIFGSRHL